MHAAAGVADQLDDGGDGDGFGGDRDAGQAEAAGDFAFVGDRYQLFLGVDDLAYEGLALGCDGLLAGVGCAFPRETVTMFDLMQAGRWDEARALYRWMTPLLHLDVSTKLVQNLKLIDARGKHLTPGLIDAHSLIYQVFHAMPEMTGPSGQPVGAVGPHARQQHAGGAEHAPHAFQHAPLGRARFQLAAPGARLAIGIDEPLADEDRAGHLFVDRPAERRKSNLGWRAQLSGAEHDAGWDEGGR